MAWMPLSDLCLCLVRRFRAVHPGVLRVSGACMRAAGSAVAHCQAAVIARKPGPGWPAVRSGPPTGRQFCPTLPAAGLQAGLPERRSATRPTRRRTRALSHDAKPFGAKDGSGLALADSRNATERSAAAVACGAPGPPLGLPNRQFRGSDGPVVPHGPWHDLDSDMLSIAQSAASPMERPTIRTAVRPRGTDEGVH